MNRCILIGRLTRDPELTTTSNGISVCKFTLAVNRTYVNANGEREADFLNIVTWRAVADNCGKYLVKGSQVAVSGRIENRSYEDANGVKRYATEVIADDVSFLSKNNNEATNGQGTAKNGKAELKPVDNDDLPF